VIQKKKERRKGEWGEEHVPQSASGHQLEEETHIVKERKKKKEYRWPTT